MDIGAISAYSDLMSSKLSNSKVDALKTTLTNGELDKASDDELMKACKEFEAYFVEQVFKGMEKTVMKADDKNSSTSTLVDFYKDQMYQALAKQSTEQTELGLAKQMYDQMKRNFSATSIPVVDATEDKTVTEEI